MPQEDAGISLDSPRDLHNQMAEGLLYTHTRLNANNDGWFLSGIAVDIDSLTVTVNNVTPALALDPVTPINEGGTATVSGSFTDIGLQDVHTVTVDWGDPNDATVSEFTVAATSALSTGAIASNTPGDTAVLTVTSVDAVTGVVAFEITRQYLDDGLAPGNATVSSSLRPGLGSAISTPPRAARG